MFKGLKILLNLIFRPHKLFSSNHFGGKKKKKNMILTPLKYGLYFFGGLISFGVFVIAFSDGIKSFEAKRTVDKYIKVTDGTPLRPNNPNGTLNGLNLLLIDTIQTEGYVKEYLSIARDLEQGAIGELNNYSTVARILGVAATEQGTYPGTVLLGSPLPVDSSGIPVWDKSKSMTLSTAYREEYESNGYTQSFVRAGNLTGDYFGPWQVAVSYIDDGSLSKSAVSKKSGFDYFHFRDQMYAYAQVRDWKYSAFNSAFGDVSASAGAKDMYVSIMYSGSPIYTYLYGDTSEEKLASLEDSYKWIHSTFVSDYNSFVNVPDLTAGWVAKFVAIVLNVKNGGKISAKTYNYATTNPQRGKCQLLLDTIGISMSVEDFLSPAIDSSLPVPGLSDGTISGMMSNIVNGKPFYMIPESIGHYVGEESLGPYYYASMLKYAGVDVDPTNPNTYMNTIPSGEWAPSGSTEWMGQYGLDPAQLGEKRTKLLNEAVKYIGSYYAWGGWGPPEKDSSGNWIPPILQADGWSFEKGFDCSSYTLWCYKTILGIDIGRTTYNQRDNPNTYVISASEAKAGDLIYYYDGDPSDGEVHGWGHVAFYIDSKTILHSPYPGKTIGFAEWDGSPTYQIREYRRVKGVE